MGGAKAGALPPGAHGLQPMLQSQLVLSRFGGTSGISLPPWKLTLTIVIIMQPASKEATLSRVGVEFDSHRWAWQ